MILETGKTERSLHQENYGQLLSKSWKEKGKSMLLKTTPVLVLGLALGLAACTDTPTSSTTSSASASTVLTGEEITLEFADQSHTAKGSIWGGNITHKSDGTLSGFDTKSNADFTGTWRVEGDRYCWVSAPSGWKGCGRATRRADGSVRISNYGTLTKQ